ncbi:hypothetical protein [Uliginosibacterium gangwonense]|uniref:hypothetical protein n=1 Tax=Uliginosibacterium gangwonense TaxID=392736 RepID=UPI00037FF61D|nr:hypothetical protein [Uliginosibacterium gangwonense]
MSHHACVAQRLLLVASLALLSLCRAHAGPLPQDAVPDGLKSWVPWVMHGQEMIACPPDWNDAAQRACVWPSTLELAPTAQGATFSLTIESFGKQTRLGLPGSAEYWPQAVTLDGKPVAVVEHEDAPVIVLPEGRHTITGKFLWNEMPQSLQVPGDLAIVHIKAGNAWASRQVDESGQIWLRAEAASEGGGEELSVRSFRQINDDQPLRVLAHFELTFAGKPREIALDNALLPGFVPVSLNSPLPARLGPDGSLRLQARAGVHVIEVEGRRMDRVLALTLPKSAGRDEVWSWQAHRELRVVDIAGNTVDPKQSGVPPAWQALPAYVLRAGDTLKITEQRRGNPDPDPDKLGLTRNLWLDFDGGGFTVQDHISGTISRSWRLEAQPPLALGHVTSDGVDQYITRLKTDAQPGFEVRHGQANIVADSRIEGGTHTLSAAGWNTDFQQLETTLNLPPGWMLLHAGGVDRAYGSWIAAWTLWDFFFVLLIALAAWKTCGRIPGALLGCALVLAWHASGAPAWMWLPALATIAAAKALAGTKLAKPLLWLQGMLAAVILLQLLAFGVEQVRLAIYPALEYAEMGYAQTSGSLTTSLLQEKAEPMPEAPPVAAAPAADAENTLSRQDYDLANKQRMATPAIKAAKPKGILSSVSRYAQDVGTQVQTGPGLPQWNWRRHTLNLQGPVSAEQKIDLWLLPPVTYSLLRIMTLVLLGLAFWQVFLRGRKWSWPKTDSRLALFGGALCALWLMGSSPDALAAEIPQVSQDAQGFQHWLDELRDKLTAAPDCMPSCAQFPRMELSADAKLLSLRLEAHAAANTAVPLPGQSAQLALHNVVLDGKPASIRRDDDGQLWIYLPKGVHQIVMEADISEAPAVNLALPLEPRYLATHLSGWSLSGVNDQGIPQGALTLNRNAGGGKAASETTRDALPPLVVVERTLNFADRWTVETHVKRIAPSLAPVQVSIPLLAGEQITDSNVRQVNGNAVLTLGTEEEASFGSALPNTPRITLKAGAAPNQVERWRVNADTRWHLSHSGLAPVLHQEGEFWLPQWQPWPGESVTLDITRPQGVPGASLTLDGLSLQAKPGARITDVTASLTLRSSLGGTHVVQLPEGATLQDIRIDGAPQTIRAEGRKINLPIHPGNQRIDITWREAKGVSLVQSSAAFDAGVAGVNVSTTLQLGADRWILAVGGPRLGPAILIWGILIVVVAVAFPLARSRVTPLGFGAWTLLGLGLAQASLMGAVIVTAWFLLLVARGRVGEKLPRWAFNLFQIFLVLASLIAIGELFDAIRTGLLGSPDMYITGNGSYDRNLIWYQDRITGPAPVAWVVSVSMWVYRGLMLLWAIWLASSVLKWVRWAWTQFSADGFWRAAPAKKNPKAEHAAPESPETAEGPSAE